MSLDNGAPPEHRHRKQPIDKPVLAVSAVVVVALCAVGIVVPDQLAKVSGAWLGWITGNLGWAFAVSASV